MNGTVVRISDKQREVLAKLAQETTWVALDTHDDDRVLHVLAANHLVEARSLMSIVQWRITAAGREALAWDAKGEATFHSAHQSSSERVAARLKLLRQSKGVTQTQLAKAVRFSVNVIKATEARKRGLGLRELDAFARFFGVPTYMLIAPEEMWQGFYKKTLDNG